MNTPVVLFVHRRLEHLPAILERVREAAPPAIYIFGDGPGDDPEDRARCAEVRAMLEGRHWGRHVVCEFADDFLGNSRRIVSGIEEVFRRESRAIFIEDDSVPASSFFGFCDDLLCRYADQPRVMMISGINPLGTWHSTECDYFFSTLGNAQAWATWKRAWRSFGDACRKLDERDFRQRMAQFLDDSEQAAERLRIYSGLSDPRAYSWDYQWALARQTEQALCVVPCRSQVVHRGHDGLATNIAGRRVLDAIASAHEIELPLRHNNDLEPDRRFDRLVFEATHDRLSPESACWFAARLMEHGRNLQAIALLRHAAAGATLDETAEGLMQRAISRVTTGRPRRGVRGR